LSRARAIRARRGKPKGTARVKAGGSADGGGLKATAELPGGAVFLRIHRLSDVRGKILAVFERLG